MNELTQARLKELFHYDPETGNFTWKVSNSNRIKIGDIAGSLHKHGYIHIQIDNKKYKAHRLAFLYMTGKFPEKGLQVDHPNHIRSDNRWINLRLVTHQENGRNQSMRKDNKSGCNGVHYDKRHNKWKAHIRIDGKNKHLGYFDNIEEAVSARKQAEIKYNFHPNHGKQNTGD